MDKRRTQGIKKVARDYFTSSLKDKREGLIFACPIRIISIEPSDTLKIKTPSKFRGFAEIFSLKSVRILPGPMKFSKFY